MRRNTSSAQTPITDFFCCPPHSAMFHRIFNDRIEAAEALATRLQEYRGRNPIILAIPRGAVPMGKVLAERLDGELDIVLVHKLGAIDETGWTYLSPEFEDDSGKLIERIKSRHLAALKGRIVYLD